MFRLSQVDEEERTQVESPTIRLSEPQELEPQELEPSSDAQVKIENGSIPGTEKVEVDSPGHEPRGAYTKTNTVVFTNPLWSALRGNGDGTERTSNTDLTNINIGKENNNNSENSTQATSNTATGSLSSSNNYEILVHPGNRSPKRRDNIKRTFCFPPSDTVSMPVGILSRPISMDSILLNGSKVRWDIDCSKPPSQTTGYPQVPPNRRKSNGGGDDLFARFGVIDTKEQGYHTLPNMSSGLQGRYSMSDTALDSPSPPLTPHSRGK